MRNYRTGNTRRSVDNESFEALRAGVGSFYGGQTETMCLLGAVAREIGILDDLAKTNLRPLRANASTAYRTDFLKSDWERRRFLRALAGLWTRGRSLRALADAINEAVGYTFVSEIWQAMPDVSTYGSNDVTITDFNPATNIVSATSAQWATLYATYAQVWRSFGKITIAINSMVRDDNCGTFQITEITPNGWSWKNPNGFVYSTRYKFFVTQSSGANCPLASDMNGVSYVDQDSFSVPGGTQYNWSAGDVFWSSIEKLRVQTVNANSYERRVAEAFLCAAVPAWVDFDFAIYEFFQLASSSNDPNFATSKLNGQTRMA